MNRQPRAAARKGGAHNPKHGGATVAPPLRTTQPAKAGKQRKAYTMENDYYYFTVDYENNAEKFWQGTGGAAFNFALWTAKSRNLERNDDSFALPNGEGYAFLTLLKNCPGWNAGSANAPHPVYVESGLTFDEIQERLDYPASRN